MIYELFLKSNSLFNRLDGNIRVIAISLIICFLIPCIGFLVSVLKTAVLYLCLKIFPKKLSYFLFYKLTFLGTIVHELSHALFVVLTGAKLVDIGFNKDEKVLGYVSFRTRGGMILASIQYALTSCAPVIVGSFLIFLLTKAKGLHENYPCLWYYLIISIAFHLSMSKQDLKQYFKGLFVLFPIIFLFTKGVLWSLFNH